MVILDIEAAEILAFPPLIPAPGLGISYAFDIGLIVGIELLNRCLRLLLSIEESARALRSLGTNRELPCLVFFDEIMFAC